MCGRCLRCWGQDFAAAWPHFLLEKAHWGHRAGTGKSSESLSRCSKKDEVLGPPPGNRPETGSVYRPLLFSSVLATSRKPMGERPHPSFLFSSLPHRLSWCECYSGPLVLTVCLAVDGGQDGDFCSVCLCLKYGPQALKAGFVSTDGLYGGSTGCV